MQVLSRYGVWEITPAHSGSVYRCSRPALSGIRATRKEPNVEGKSQGGIPGISSCRRVAVAESPRNQRWLCWRPICGFAEPDASVSGRGPGKPTGEFRRSRPAPRKAGWRCGSAGSGRFQLALSAGFTCDPGGFRQSTRWPNHLKGRREGFQNRRPSSAYST
jgi:hypothetical protein